MDSKAATKMLDFLVVEVFKAIESGDKEIGLELLNNLDKGSQLAAKELEDKANRAFCIGFLYGQLSGFLTMKYDFEAQKSRTQKRLFDATGG